MSYGLIKPLDDSSVLAVPEVAAQATLWSEHRARLEAAGKLANFRTRLDREWAIETGLIERLYVWDRGTTELLIEQGIDAAILRGRGYEPEQADRIKALIDDQGAVVQGLFDFVNRTRPLSESYIRELHAALTRSQEFVVARTADGRAIEVPLVHGEYKRQPNNPTRSDGTVHEYCPPEHVVDEMERLVEWYAELDDGPPEVVSAWLHHRFTQIHPFADGNGRVARALASLVFIKAGLFPLVVRNDERRRYIEALEQADAGELGALVRLFADGQLRACAAALKDSDTETKREAQRLIREAAVGSLRRSRDPGSPAWALAEALVESALWRLREEAQELTDALSGVGGPLTDWSSWALRGMSADNLWKLFSRKARKQREHQLVSEFDALGLSPFEDPRNVRVVLAITTDSDFYTWLSFTGVEGVRGQGIACVVSTLPMAELGVEPFVLLGTEDPASATARFEHWLEEALILVLEAWRRGLDG